MGMLPFGNLASISPWGRYQQIGTTPNTNPRIGILNYYLVIKRVALVLNVFILILSAIHVKQSLVNPDEYSSSKTAVIDVYFIRMLGYALYITSCGVAALR